MQSIAKMKIERGIDELQRHYYKACGCEFCVKRRGDWEGSLRQLREAKYPTVKRIRIRRGQAYEPTLSERVGLNTKDDYFKTTVPFSVFAHLRLHMVCVSSANGEQYQIVGLQHLAGVRGGQDTYTVEFRRLSDILNPRLITINFGYKEGDMVQVSPGGGMPGGLYRVLSVVQDSVSLQKVDDE